MSSTSVRHTLVLNSDYQPMGSLPLTTVDWKDAITAVHLGSVEAVTFYDNWTVRSPSRPMIVPAVVRKTSYVNIKRMIAYAPEMVFLRDGYRCQYCSKVFPENKLTCDHVKPVSKGGLTEFSNIVAACGPCNSRRGNDERIRPKNPPYRPTPSELVSKRKLQPVTVPHASWIDFIGWAPELVRVVEPSGQPGYVPLAQHEIAAGAGDADYDLMMELLLQQA